MSKYLQFEEARFRLAHEVNQAIAEKLKELLETKHLYQNVVVDVPALFEKYFAQLILDNQQLALRRFSAEVLVLNLVPSETEIYASVDRRYQLPTLLLQNVKLYCSVCKQRETFSPTVCFDVSEEVAERRKNSSRMASHPASFQLFVLTYQCETCRKVPVAFIVKRNGWKLTLEGRSPFEEVVVPKFIPKGERWLFSGAIVATQTGNTLAGLFYLRSFIEQFARRQTGIWDRQPGEVILDAYQALLPEKVRDHMPSLRSWYERLSEPIHSAKPDEAIFQEALREIIEHFDFRRIYKIPEVVPAPSSGSVPASGV
jgi:hypothetical protein